MFFIKNKIIIFVLPIFDRLSQSIFGESNEDFSNLRKDAINLIDQAIINLEKEKINSTQIRYIQYAIVAWIDEQVMHSDWKGKNTWMANSLQLFYFDNHIAGEVFFENLNHLRLSPSESIDVLEIYYLCLSLNFQGKYKNASESLKCIQKNLLEDIDKVRHHPEIEQHAHKDVEKKKWKKQRITAMLTMFFILIAYIGYDFFIYWEGHVTEREIKHLAEKMSSLKKRQDASYVG